MRTVAVQRHGRAAAVALVLVVTDVGLLGCTDAGTVSTAEFERSTGAELPEQGRPERASDIGAAGGGPGLGGQLLAPPPTVTTPSAPAIGWHSGQAVVAAAGARAGTSEPLLHQAVLYPGYAIVSLVDPAAGRTDRFTIRTLDDITVDAGVVRGFGDLRATAFPPSSVSWDVIPGLVASTPGALGVASPVSHVIVEHNHPFSPDIVIRVYVADAGRIDHLADGRVLRAFPG